MTVVDARAAQPAELVTVTVYIPAFATLADEIVGFWLELENPLGPAQEYDVPPLATSEIVSPGQYGPLFAAVAAGIGNTVTERE
jgi:hypothetical protein